MNDRQLKQLLREADAGAPSAVSEPPLDVAVLESHAARRRTRRHRFTAVGASAVLVALVGSVFWITNDRESDVAAVRQSATRDRDTLSAPVADAPTTPSESDVSGRLVATGRPTPSDPDTDRTPSDRDTASGPVAELPTGALSDQDAASVLVADAPPVDVDALRAEIAALNAEAAWREQLVVTMQASVAADRAAAELARLKCEFEPAGPLQAELAFRREVDRSAIIRLTFADRLAEDLGDFEAAAAEYRRVAEHFQGTHWAATATDRLARGDAM